MALTVEQLQAQRDEIVAQMSAPQQVAFKGRSETLRPQAELEAALRRVDAEIARLQAPQDRQFTVQTKRGLD